MAPWVLRGDEAVGVDSMPKGVSLARIFAVFQPQFCIPATSQLSGQPEPEIVHGV